jgi:hypothetical protein
MKSIQEYISEVEDFRIEKKCLHKLSDILLIGLFTYFLSNGEDYEDMVLFAQSHKEFLKPYATLPNGIPSHDTFSRYLPPGIFAVESRHTSALSE